MTRARIFIGNSAGHHFQKKSDLVVAYHAERRWNDGRCDKGRFMRRKWLAGDVWACEQWFEWDTGNKETL